MTRSIYSELFISSHLPDYLLDNRQSAHHPGKYGKQFSGFTITGSFTVVYRLGRNPPLNIRRAIEIASRNQQSKARRLLRFQKRSQVEAFGKETRHRCMYRCYFAGRWLGVGGVCYLSQSAGNPPPFIEKHLVVIEPLGMSGVGRHTLAHGTCKTGFSRCFLPCMIMIISSFR